MSRFSRKVVLVTGGASGIGAAIAARLSSEGAAVAIGDLDLEAAEALAAGLPSRCVGIRLDVADPNSVAAGLAALERRLGPLDVLVNNAASCTDATLAELSEEQWARDLEVTLGGPFRCAKAALATMAPRRSGVICNIGSVNAFQFLGNEAYSAAKGGLVSLTQAIAVRYGPTGIRCNLIAPGTVATPAWDARLARQPDLFEQLSGIYPLGRVGTPEDIAAAAAFLCSDEARWITGAVLAVDGGLLAGRPGLADDIAGTDRSP
ncbi:MAG: SDR family oxidoreductase [Actinomycetota bacterium]|nr:SDR family oxidoreductase [Actinomycetota bacterium]